MRVLVTSAYGNQGRKLIPKLVRSGITVRALDIAEEAYAGLTHLGAAEIMIADAADGAVLEDALAGVDAVYHVGPNAHPQEREMGLSIVNAAGAARIRHFVYSSVLYPNISALKQHILKLDVEQRLIQSGLPFTILRPAHYMQTLQHCHAFRTGVFRLTWSVERRQALVDVEDITSVAEKIITEGERHFHATYELCSEQGLTGHDIAHAIAEIVGRPVDAHEVSPPEVIRSLFPDSQSGTVFEDRVRMFTAVARWYSAHDFMGNAQALMMLLGREPLTLHDFLKREYEAFVASR